MMPNTPCLVGASASAMCLGGQASEEDGEAVRTLFDAVGTIFKVCRHAHSRKGPTQIAIPSSCNTKLTKLCVLCTPDTWGLEPFESEGLLVLNGFGTV